ncbi:MAG: BON domain-containing protein [Desulfovibrionales bacterium]
MSVIEEKIKRDVVEQLYWDDRVDASQVLVRVFEGVVTLSGTVSSRQARESAEQDAWVISGVMKVQNLIEIEPLGELTIPTDEEIRKHLENLYVLNPDIESATVYVSVEDGVAGLRGTVDSYWKKLKAEQLASEVRGIRRVVNELSVVPTNTISDKAIADRVMDALERNMNVDAGSVDVTVEEGIVVLSGRVLTPNSYWSAQQTAMFTSGVREVHNKLTIRPI